MPRPGEAGPIQGDERDLWLTLALAPGIGAARFAHLVNICGSASGVFGASQAFLRAVPGMTASVAAAIKAAPRSAGRAVRRAVEAIGGEVLLPGDPVFPQQLENLPHPPSHLFALGRTELFASPAVAVVGSRNHSDYGAEVCAALASAAALAGVVVVSGMARGLDAVAHRAALRVDGETIGVLGNGLGVVYPQVNRTLYREVARRGLLLTEHPPGERPQAGSFPRRNRLIAGLARATVVVEAAEGSGALITAGHALEQGRDVLAVPGAITSPRSRGTNRLISDGARPLLTFEDLLGLYPEASRGQLPTPALSETPRGRLLAALANGPAQVDELSGRLGWRPEETLGLLGVLEIEGLVAQRPGMVFVRRLGWG